MFKTDLAYDNWKEKYRYLNETPIETWKRVARTLASVEKEEDREKWEKKFLETLVKFDDKGNPVGLHCTTGGRITANIGTEFKGATLINCYITGPVKNAEVSYVRQSEDKSISYPIKIKTKDDPDDLMNIFLTIMEQAKTLASEGGYGINFDFIRPRGSLIKGTGIKHPGIIPYLDIWDKVADCIVKGDTDGYVDKIKNYLGEKSFKESADIIKAATRKGAMMGVLSCQHPDIEEFIRAKQTSGVLTKFNLSVAIDDKFMKAVEADDFYDLTFGGKVYKRVKAKDLYDLIMESTYNRAEPGIIFIDNMHSNNPISYLGKANCTNPCCRKGTLVATAEGLRSIEDIKVGDLIQTTLGFEPVKDIEVHEDTDIYRVTFSDSSYLDVSEGHIFHTQSEYTSKKWDTTKRLNDPSIGKFTYVRKDRYKFKTENNLEWGRDLGLFAGLYLGFGYIDEENHVCLSDKESEIWISSMMSRLGFKVTSSDYLRYNMGLDIISKEKTFPYQWLNTNEQFLCGLLDGLISSIGTVNYDDNIITMTSSSLNLHTMIRHLFLYFGANYNLSSDKINGIISNGSVSRVHDRLKYISDPDKNILLKKTIKTMAVASNGSIPWRVAIDSIELVGKDTVYDLHAEDADDWNTCGIVSRGCGEIPGLPGLTSVCLLGSLNIPQYIYIEGDTIKFDWAQYEEDIKTFTRMLDNVNDITYNALPSYDWATKNLRQIGMGIGGLGSALMMLGIPYNSKEAVEFTKRLCETKENLTWQASALLAKEKGTFKAYDKEKFENTKYFKSKRISEETKNLIRKYGVRNAKTTTNPPLGNCVIPNTKIKTTEGIKSIREIFKINGISSVEDGTKGWYNPTKDTYVETMLGARKISRLYINSAGEVLTVTTAKGYKITGTKAHKLLVNMYGDSQEWVRLEDLTKGLSVVLQAKSPKSADTFEISGMTCVEDKIVSIKKSVKLTVDLEIEEAHHYILSNGIISHNSSVITDNTSNGIEPVFLLEYDRKKICNKWPEGLDQSNVKSLLKYYKEKDYEYWQGMYNGKKYYYEPHNRGLCEVIVVRDFGYQWLLENFPNKDHSKYLITTKDLKVEDHINIQEVVQLYNNQSVSKTCCLPKNYPFKDFKSLYMDAWKRGLNGFTTYRDGTMESVFSATVPTAQEARGIIKRDLKLPSVFLNGPTKVIKREGIKFYLNYSYLPDDKDMKFPVVLWISTNNKDKNASSVCNKASRKLAKLALKLGIDNKFVEATVSKAKDDYPHNRLGRIISLCLRHNIPRVEILTALMNIEGDNVSTLLTAVRKFLQESLEDGTHLKGIKCAQCNGDRVVLQSGCKVCLDCSFSGCG